MSMPYESPDPAPPSGLRSREVVIAVGSVVLGFVLGLTAGVVTSRPGTSAPAVAVEATAPASATRPQAQSAPAIRPITPPVEEPQAGEEAPVEGTGGASADAVLAHRLVSLSGETLVGELWTLEGQADPSVTFAALQRNAERFAGRPAMFRGEVMEIRDLPSNGGSFLRLGVGHYGNDVIAVFTYETPADSLVVQSRVRVYGRMAGSYSYTSQAGWNITIPRIVAVAVVRDSAVPRRPAR